MAADLRQLTPREEALVGKYRLQHGPVAGVGMVADSDGNIGAPLLQLPLLARLEQRGVIDRRSAAAGARFHELFRIASLDTLKAADVSRVPLPPGTARHDLPASGERARRAVSDVMTALGGAGSAAASVIWNVCGLETSVRQWALTTQRPEHLCAGILVGALSALAGHFDGHKPRR